MSEEEEIELDAETLKKIEEEVNAQFAPLLNEETDLDQVVLDEETLKQIELDAHKIAQEELQTDREEFLETKIDSSLILKSEETHIDMEEPISLPRKKEKISNQKHLKSKRKTTIRQKGHIEPDNEFYDDEYDDIENTSSTQKMQNTGFIIFIGIIVVLLIVLVTVLLTVKKSPQKPKKINTVKIIKKQKILIKQKKKEKLSYEKFALYVNRLCGQRGRYKLAKEKITKRLKESSAEERTKLEVLLKNIRKREKRANQF